MGFRPQVTLYKLKFADSNLDGLEVTAESLTTDEFLAMQRLASQAKAGTNADATASAEKMLDGFAANLASWNLEDSHGPVPATREGVGSQKFDLVLVMIMAWMEAIAGVDPTSRAASNGGATSQELSIPMEVSSPSPTS
jgi:hypothetical protein